MTGPVLIGAAVVLVVLVVVIALVVVRGRSRPAAPMTGATGPSSPTAIVCSFCKREYEPAQAGGRCPSCGAATPRGR